ncbi:MAG: aminotransferase class III-fold pyridoxal phosphate-dependent enzyme [Campylobacterota bacterium]|nr:aminotransferase class III-fold pyridoxal phosphate-dependent enzyme [Campylobacterota bacterium]
MNLEQTDKQYVLNTYARNYVNFTKGTNATLFDDNNNKYIDFTSGIGVVSVGHGNKEVADVIYEQVSNITHVSNLYAIEPQAKLAKKLVELSGYDMACFFGNSGAEANEGAIKIARKYGETKFNSKKYKIVTLGHSFHGRTITTVKASGQKKMHSDNFSPYPDGFSYKHKLDDIYEMIDDETVAVMIELIQGEGGVQPFPKKDIQKLAKFLKEKELLLIVDEVQTGGFRTGEFLASNLYDIEPDIITLAKGIGGGVPIGVVMTKHKDIFSPGDHGSTFGGNYLVTSAANKVCEILEKHKDSGILDETIIYFETKLKELYQNNKHLFYREVGLGLMRGLRVNDEETLSKIVNNAFDEGLLLLKAGKITLRFLPPLTITKDEINEGFKRLENVLKTI